MPVAILIVNYRVYGHVDRALTSLASFLRPDDEIVLVDHASDAGLRSSKPGTRA